jgi:hypothetical protein
MAHMCPRRWHTRAQRTRDLPTVDEDPKMKSRIGSHFAAALLVLTALPGCMQSRVEESRELHTKIQKDESVVILAKPQIEGAATEDGFMDCVSRGLAGNGPDAISVQSNTTFVDSMFPWFEPGTAPTRPEGIATLLTRPGVSERVAASGVRYIVWLDGGTQKTDGGGSIACGAAPGAAGCIGFGWWEKESNYEATVWDLKQAKSAGSVDTNVTGTSAIVGAVVPLPFIARVQNLACNRMAGQLRTFFTGSDDIDAPRSILDASNNKPTTLASRAALRARRAKGLGNGETSAGQTAPTAIASAAGDAAPSTTTVTTSAVSTNPAASKTASANAIPARN